MEKRVAEELGTLEGGGDVVGEAWVAVVSTGSDRVELRRRRISGHENPTVRASRKRVRSSRR